MRDVPPVNADVRWCRALGSKRVMAHAFRIELATGTLAIRALCLTAERGDLASSVVPRCKRCLAAAAAGEPSQRGLSRAAAFSVDGSARASDATGMDTTPPVDAAQLPPSFVPTTPKADLFTWCGMTKVPLPTFAIAEVPGGGFEGHAVLVLLDGVSLTTEVHRARGRKLVEHAASAELLALLEKHVGPEGMRPPRAPEKQKKAKKTKTVAALPAPPPPAAVPAVRVPTEEDRRAARLAAIHRALSAESTATPIARMNILKQLGYVRSLRVAVRAHPMRRPTLVVDAECVRGDGSRVCFASFEATDRMEAETRATAKAIESLAASMGLRPRLAASS